MSTYAFDPSNPEVLKTFVRQQVEWLGANALIKSSPCNRRLVAAFMQRMETELIVAFEQGYHRGAADQAQQAATPDKQPTEPIYICEACEEIGYGRHNHPPIEPLGYMRPCENCAGEGFNFIGGYAKPCSACNGRGIHETEV